MIDFTKVGGLVKITITDDPITTNNGTWYKNRSAAKVDLRVMDDGITDIKMFVIVDDLEIQVQSFDQISIAGAFSVSDLPSFETAIAEVFLEVGGATLTPGAIGPNIFGIGDSTTLEGNTGDYIFAFGTMAGKLNSGFTVAAIGNDAARENTGNGIVAIGGSAAYHNLGSWVNGLGNNAANGNTGNNLNAFGAQSGMWNSGANVNALGNTAGASNTGTNVNFMGLNAGVSNTANAVNAFGVNAGANNTYANVNLFGENATADGAKQTVFSAGNWCVRFDLASLNAHKKIVIPNIAGTMAITSTANNFANDAAAATGGVPVGAIYHTSGAAKVRLI